MPCCAKAGAVTQQRGNQATTKQDAATWDLLSWGTCDSPTGRRARRTPTSKRYRHVRQVVKDTLILWANAAWSVPAPLCGVRRRGSDLRSRLDAVAHALPGPWAGRCERGAGGVHGRSCRRRRRGGTNGGTIQPSDARSAIYAGLEIAIALLAVLMPFALIAVRPLLAASYADGAGGGSRSRCSGWRSASLALRAGGVHGRDVSDCVAMDGARAVDVRRKMPARCTPPTRSAPRPAPSSPASC